MMHQKIFLGNFHVDVSSPPIFFAEIGSFFNGDHIQAKHLMERVISIRDKVPEQPVVLKTEILHNPDICLPGPLEETYANKAGEIKKENYRQLIERKVMKLDSYSGLFATLVKSDMPFVVSVYDFEAADFARAQGAAGLKIASANIVHIPLIRHVAKMGLPMVIDTGRSTIAEVFHAVDTARKSGCKNIIIQHSPDGHPALPEAHNLRILQTYQQCFNLPVGLSDHYTGVEMLYMAIALGASVLEKGIYTDPKELDQDIAHSMGIDDLEQTLNRIYDCWLALGDSARDLSKKIKGVIGSSQRPGLVAKRDLMPGDKISLETVRFAYPCLGISAAEWDVVLDMQIQGPVAAGQPIGWTHINTNVCRFSSNVA